LVDYKKILQLHAEGVSGRAISEALGCSRNSVASVLSLAAGVGMTFEQVADLDSAAVRRLLLPEPVRVDSGRKAPDFEWVHQQMQRPNVTLQLLWSEYAVMARREDAIPLSYSSFCENYRKWMKITGATMRIPRKPVGSIEVDWAGDKMEFFDQVTAEAYPAYLFVAVLPFSSYFYVEAFPDMTLESWIDGHVAAFEFFGGSARLLVPDNLRSGVTKADRYEPTLNEVYARMADHYNTAIVPARVRRPRDKSLAENSVRHGANAIIAVLRDRVFFGLDEINKAIFEQVAHLNSKSFKKRAGSRFDAYIKDEKPLLTPLPPTRFELAEFLKRKVGRSYHIQVDGSFYSVPARLIGKTVDVRVTSKLVEAFDSNERVATHIKLIGKNRYQTTPEHMPPAHRAQLQDMTPAELIAQAREIGLATKAVVKAILDSKDVVEQTYRSVLGVLSLARKSGGHDRLEQTCEIALEFTPLPSYTLVKRLWDTWKPTATQPASLADAGFVRGANYYRTETSDD
jgi:transposase